MAFLHAAQDTPDRGLLQVNVVSSENNFPVENATVSIANSDTPEQILEELTTDSSGQTEEVSLPAPPLEYSQQANEPRPYTDYIIRVTAPGFEPMTIDGTEVLPSVLALQGVRLRPLVLGPSSPILIPDHTLYGTYPPKIPEDEIKPTNESDEIVLSRVVVPQTVVVHDGVPSDASAKDYFIPYRDYIRMSPPAKSMPPAPLHHCGQCTGHHVLYFKPGLYRVVTPYMVIQVLRKIDSRRTSML